MVPADDREVVRLAISGDTEAFTELYRRHSARVRRHILYMVGNESEADDLTSEAFLLAWKAIGKYEDRGLPIQNWLLRIGHNLGGRHLKRRRPLISVDGIELPADSRKSPEQVLEMTSEAEAVRRAVLALPGVQRQVIVWRFLENLSYGEIEQLLNKSQGAIRVIQYRALKQLRSLLASDMDTQEKAAPSRSARRQDKAPASGPIERVPVGAFS